MKKIILIILYLPVAAMAQGLDAKSLIEQSATFHDPHDNWSTTKLEIHIQEPRIANPLRYSIIKMDNELGLFELSRNREEHISTHIINSDGSSEAVLDGETITDPELIEQFRLGAQMNNIYKNMYDMMVGLPMSLTSDKIAQYGEVTKTEFNGKNAFRVSIVLKEPLFSEYWNVFLSIEDKEILGLEIYFPDDPKKGERLYFGGHYHVNEISIPRYRHWHEFSDDSFSGSDIIVK